MELQNLEIPATQPQIQLPLTDVVPSEIPHHVCYDVIQSYINDGEKKIAELKATLAQAQSQLTGIETQKAQIQKLITDLNTNGYSLEQQVKAFKNLHARIISLDPQKK